MLSGECVSFCDLGLHKGTNRPLPGKEEEPQTI